MGGCRPAYAAALLVVSSLAAASADETGGCPGGCGAGACVGGRCSCAAAFRGPRCGEPVGFSRQKHFKQGQLGFRGAITMGADRMKGRKSVEVTLPGKEAGDGHRVLGPVDAALLGALPRSDALGGAVWRECAVVGSSGSLLERELGAEIDAHDAVLRFNSAPTRGLEAHVGSKTTLRITNTQNWAFRETDDEQLLVHMRARASLVAFLRTRQRDKSLKMAAFDPEFVQFMADAFDFMPTSGLYGIVIALLRCRAVHLYGFQVSAKQGALYHYYDPCDRPANAERDGAEWHVVKALNEAGAATFREPCVAECHEGKDVCARCKESAGLGAPLDLTRFRATALQYDGQRLLRRPADKTDYASRAKNCPPCSSQFGGCRPPRHWAFARERGHRHGGGAAAGRRQPHHRLP